MTEPRHLGRVRSDAPDSRRSTHWSAGLATIAEHLDRADDLFLKTIREIDRRSAEHGDDRLASLRDMAAAIRGDLMTVRNAVLRQASGEPTAPRPEHAAAFGRVVAAAWGFADESWATLSSGALDEVASAAIEQVSLAIDAFEGVWSGVWAVEMESATDAA